MSKKLKNPPGKYLEIIYQLQITKPNRALINGNFTLIQYDSKAKTEERAKYISSQAHLPDTERRKVACVIGLSLYPNPFAGGFFSLFCVLYYDDPR